MFGFCRGSTPKEQGMTNKERIKKLFSDGKRRWASDVAEELDIPPKEVIKIFRELDKEMFFEEQRRAKG